MCDIVREDEATGVEGILAGVEGRAAGSLAENRDASCRSAVGNMVMDVC
jgi:hypothetical protein